MTRTPMRSMLRMAIFGGAVALSPALAVADTWRGPDRGRTSEVKPDHATAEAHGAEEPSGTVPDHNAAQPATGPEATRPSGLDTIEGVPTHEEAQARGASPSPSR